MAAMEGEGDDSVYISEDEDESTQQRIDSARQLPPILLRVSAGNWLEPSRQTKIVSGLLLRHGFSDEESTKTRVSDAELTRSGDVRTWSVLALEVPTAEAWKKLMGRAAVDEKEDLPGPVCTATLSLQMDALSQAPEAVVVSWNAVIVHYTALHSALHCIT